MRFLKRLQDRTRAEYEAVMRLSAPTMPYFQKDGKWYSRKTGEEVVSMNLSEFLKFCKGKKK